MQVSAALASAKLPRPMLCREPRKLVTGSWSETESASSTPPARPRWCSEIKYTPPPLLHHAIRPESARSNVTTQEAQHAAETQRLAVRRQRSRLAEEERFFHRQARAGVAVQKEAIAHELRRAEISQRKGRDEVRRAEREVEAQHGVVVRALDAAYHATNAARSSDRRTIAREVMHANQQMAAAKAERAEREVRLALEEDRAMLRAEARGPF